MLRNANRFKFVADAAFFGINVETVDQVKSNLS